MTCVDQKFQIWGDYDSDRAQNLMIVFELCQPDPATGKVCKSKKEIDDFLLGKYIYVLENEKTFIQHKY